jgi:hypothetical protein
MKLNILHIKRVGQLLFSMSHVCGVVTIIFSDRDGQE